MVLQETNLGPILFNLYINDLIHLKTSGAAISFVYDAVVMYSADMNLLKLKRQV